MEGYIAEVRLFAGNFQPRNWAYCSGQLMAISQNQALFSLIGCTYGGDCRTTFALPDLRGRTAIGDGTGPGLSTYREGQKTGTPTVTLTSSQIPSHNHTVTSNLTATLLPGCNTTADSDETENTYPATSSEAAFNATPGAETMPAETIHMSGSITCSTAGGNQSHNNMMPSLAMNYIICLFGIFPSRG